MFSIIKLINTYFWKSLIGPIIVFIFSVLWVGITLFMWNIFGVISPTQVLPSSFFTYLFILCLVIIPITINDLNKSIIFKKLGASTFTPPYFMVVFLLYFYFIGLAGFFYQMPWTYIFMYNNIQELSNFFKGANWPEIFYIYTISFLMTSSIGIFVSTVLKQNYKIIIFAVIFITLSIPLACLAVPITLVHNSVTGQHTHIPALSKLVYIDPLWYLTSGASEIWTKFNHSMNVYQSDYFNIDMSFYSRSIAVNVYPIEILNKGDKITNIFMPIFICLALSIANLKYFKWNTR